MNESADRPRDNEPDEPGAPEDAELLMRSEPLDEEYEQSRRQRER